MGSLIPQVFANTRCALGESPVWDERVSGLYWLDILNRQMFFKAEGAADYRTWALPCICSAVFLTASDFPGVVLATEQGLATFNVHNATFKLLGVTGDERQDLRSNDGGVDRHGRLWFGTMAKKGGTQPGAVYCWTAGTGFQKVFDQVFIPNTFIWNRDGTVLIFADSFHGKVFRYSCNSLTGAPENVTAIIDLSGSGAEPDGSAMDEKEMFWNAQWNGSRVVRYALDGIEADVVPVPVLRPTSCCFGGADFSTLFITSAMTDLSSAQEHTYPLSGAVFRVQTGTRGLPVPRVTGINVNGELA